MRYWTISCLAAMTIFGASCGGDDGASDEQIREARSDARQEERLRQLEREQRQRDRRGPSSPPSDQGTPPPADTPAPPRGGQRDCGGGVSAGPNTTCVFAREVRRAYERGGGSSTVEVYSPATGQTYTMSCSSGSPHVCTGGRNASVYFP